ncbi:TetR/AcrR family transcriptional regulator [Actinomadura sp. WMMB 499]|uniref:TetR/AcrR family transcriptional regulator n=1 Tax=Actinomadura sp. WMMB 499 TaxID=1219491 RepID=UPI001C3FCD05|nr:TetR/AcrR family transcriptional regulator [Actinomadura sp. WMMB 499]
MEKRRALLQAAIALWRTNGFAGTTVADICKAAGVSKALFYFYFPTKEDALAEAGVLSTGDARRVARARRAGPGELPEAIGAVLAALERSMRHSPPDLLIEATLEGHRAEHRALREGRPDEHHASRYLFLELLRRAQRDGGLPPGLDVLHVARGVQALLEAGTRHWAAGEYGDRGFAEVVGRDIAAFVAGHARIASGDAQES